MNDVVERPEIKDEIQLIENNSKIPEKVSFNKVREHCGPFDLFTYRVSGKEMNDHLLELQKEFAEQNRRDTIEMDQLKKIYAAISVLDDDYLKKLVDNAETMKSLSGRVDECVSTHDHLSGNIQDVVNAQKVILDKFSSFDNVLLLEEQCRNQKEEIRILKEELDLSKEEAVVLNRIKKNVENRLFVYKILIGVIGVLLVANIVLNILGIL